MVDISKIVKESISNIINEQNTETVQSMYGLDQDSDSTIKQAGKKVLSGIKKRVQGMKDLDSSAVDEQAGKKAVSGETVQNAYGLSQAAEKAPKETVHGMYGLDRDSDNVVERAGKKVLSGVKEKGEEVSNIVREHPKLAAATAAGLAAATAAGLAARRRMKQQKSANV